MITTSDAADTAAAAAADTGHPAQPLVIYHGNCAARQSACKSC